MSGKQALVEKLRRDRPSVATRDELLERQKGVWVDDLAALMGRIAGWLSAEEAEGLVEIERRNTEIVEQDLGAYGADALTVHLRTSHPRAVKIEPKGMRVVGVIAAADRRIVGASGRVDLTCGAARAILLRMKGEATTWKLVTPSGEAVDLTEDTFSDALGELIE